MKVMFAIKTLDDAHGGAERVLTDVAGGLSERGYDVSVLSYDKPGGTSFYPLNPKVERIPLGVGRTDCKTTPLETLARMKVLRSVIQKEKPDIIIAFMHSMFAPLSLALIGTGIPIVASEHIVPAHYRTRPHEFALLVFSSFFVKRMTVLSRSVKMSYPRIIRRKILSVVNPVMVDGKSKADAAGVSRERKIILNVGRLEAQKDQETLIRAFASLAFRYPDWDLRIIGEGSERSRLESVVWKLDLEQRVQMPGIVRDIGREYASAQIFALPSSYESFGLATAEAMACGLPAIGFANCPGTNELIVDGKNGILVNGGERISAFAGALDSLMRDPDRRIKYGQAGVKDVEVYSLDRVMDVWERVIGQVCRHAPDIKPEHSATQL